MNLQTIQKRVEELSAELLTLSNDLAFLVSGNISRKQAPENIIDTDWAKDMKAGDVVQCVAVHSGSDVRQRCFTVGDIYTVENRLTSSNPNSVSYGIRVERDDEGDGHDARGVVFVKVA